MAGDGISGSMWAKSCSNDKGRCCGSSRPVEGKQSSALKCRIYFMHPAG